MIEKLIPLEIPPGIVKNGTLYERAGRWIDGDKVRFTEAGPRAILGSVSLSMDTPPPGGTPCGALAVTNVGSRILVGSSTKLWSLDFSFTYPGAPHEVNDYTASMPAGTFAVPLTWWQFDTLGAKIIAASSSGLVYAIDLSVPSFTDVTPASAIVSGIMVTDEQFLVVFGQGAPNRTLWASQGTTNFVPASTNTAGSLDLRNSPPLMAGRVVNRQNLMLSSEGLWQLAYVGGDLVYGLHKLAGGCGLIGPRALCVHGNELYWMGHKGFWRFNGYPQPLACDLMGEIFGSVTAGKEHTIFAERVGDDEIWFHWPTAGSATPNRVAIYNTSLGVWSRAEISAAASIGTGFWPRSGSTAVLGSPTVPVLFPSGGTTAIEYEQPGTVLSGAFLESGPLMLDAAGNNRFTVQKWVADNNQVTLTTDDLTLYVGEWPKQGETSLGTLPIPSATGLLADFGRPKGRYLRFKQTLKDIGSQIGTPRAGIVQGEPRSGA